MAVAHHLDPSLEISVHLYLFLESFLYYFGKTIGNLSGVPTKRSRILSRRLMICPLHQDPLGMLLQVLEGPSLGIPIHSVLLVCFVDEFYVLLFKVCLENFTSGFSENATASAKRFVVDNWIF